MIKVHNLPAVSVQNIRNRNILYNPTPRIRPPPIIRHQGLRHSFLPTKHHPTTQYLSVVMKGVHQRIKHQVQVKHDKGKVPHVDINSNPCNYRVDKNLGYQLGEPGYEVQAD